MTQSGLHGAWPLLACHWSDSPEALMANVSLQLSAVQCAFPQQQQRQQQQNRESAHAPRCTHSDEASSEALIQGQSRRRCLKKKSVSSLCRISPPDSSRCCEMRCVCHGQSSGSMGGLQEASVRAGKAGNPSPRRGKSPAGDAHRCVLLWDIL